MYIYFMLFFFSMFFSSVTLGFTDAAVYGAIYFQNPASPIMEGIISFYDTVSFFLIFIALFVSYILIYIIIKFGDKIGYSLKTSITSITHSSLLEIIWTTLPACILLFLATPSYSLLYSMDVDSFFRPTFTLKVIGHQWYWEYEFNNYNPKPKCPKARCSVMVDRGIHFESFMLSESDLVVGQFRLLEVDNRVIVPEKLPFRVLVTSQDVLHSWCVPSLGLKIDAAPGRLNEIPLFIAREGTFYGQCSEICGINHGFMPIVIQSVNHYEFLYYSYILSTAF